VVLPVEEGVAFHDALDIEQPVAGRVGVRKASADFVAVDAPSTTTWPTT
jgi:hypothetical protein